MKLSVFLLLLIPITAPAADIIFDSGNTVSAKQYRHDIGVDDHNPERPSVGGLISPHTPEMTLGRVSSRSINLPYLPNPLFLIGTDSTSIAWLSKHAKALKRAGAKGFVVNSSSPQSLQKTVQAGQGLEITPASGSELAIRFNLRHYPVLITRKQIAQ